MITLQLLGIVLVSTYSIRSKLFDFLCISSKSKLKVTKKVTECKKIKLSIFQFQTQYWRPQVNITNGYRDICLKPSPQSYWFQCSVNKPCMNPVEWIRILTGNSLKIGNLVVLKPFPLSKLIHGMLKFLVYCENAAINTTVLKRIKDIHFINFTKIHEICTLLGRKKVIQLMCCCFTTQAKWLMAVCECSRMFTMLKRHILYISTILAIHSSPKERQLKKCCNSFETECKMCRFNVVNVREHLRTAINHFTWVMLKLHVLIYFSTRGIHIWLWRQLLLWRW